MRSPTFRLRRIRFRLLAAAALAAGLAGCESGFFVEPAQLATGLEVSYDLSPEARAQVAAAGGPAAAFDKVDAIRVSVRTSSGAQDTIVGFTPASEVRVPVVVRLSGSEETVEVTFALQRGAEAVFRGSASTRLKLGEQKPLVVSLEPVPAGVVLSGSSFTMTAIGDTLALSATVLFATGDHVPNAAISWSSQSQNIAAVDGSGRVISRAEGQTQVVASYQGHSATATIRVAPQVASVSVTPAEAEVQVQKTTQLSAVARDRRGNSLNRPIAWSSEDQGIATIDGAGTVQGVAPGSVTIRAMAEGQIGTARVTVTSAPSAGADVVVFNDLNMFDNGFGIRDENNQRLVRNLVRFTSTGVRNQGTEVWFDRGRNSVCRNDWCSNDMMSTMREVITGVGMSITDVESTSGSLTSVPANVKVIFLWLPLVAYTVPEINTLKRFAAEGGRIIFIGEHSGYYGEGIPIENQFLRDMGAGMQNVGGVVACSRTLPASSLRPHQITEGLTGMFFACASAVVPVEGDYPLAYDTDGVTVLAAVAKIDTRPLASMSGSALGNRVAAPQPTAPPFLDPVGRPLGTRRE